MHAAGRHRVDVLLADTVRLAVARELSVVRDVPRIFEAARAGGVQMLLLKGTALAYTHYPRPHLRPRNDVDLLVRPADLARVGAVLVSAGFERAPEADAGL